MVESRTEKAYEVTWLVRRLFRTMAATADRFLNDSDLTAADRAVIDYTDAMTNHIRVPDEAFARVRQHFDDRALIELTLAIGGYNLVSRFIEALHIDLDES